MPYFMSDVEDLLLLPYKLMLVLKENYPLDIGITKTSSSLAPISEDGGCVLLLVLQWANSFERIISRKKSFFQLYSKASSTSCFMSDVEEDLLLLSDKWRLVLKEYILFILGFQRLILVFHHWVRMEDVSFWCSNEQTDLKAIFLTTSKILCW